MIDYLFVGPLGWKKNIWDQVTSCLENKTCDFIEFSNQSEEYINEVDLTKELEKKINLVKKTGSIVAVSYGSRLLLYSLESMTPQVKSVVFIEGFEDIPNIEMIRNDLQFRKELFESMDDYINLMLDDKEKQNPYILAAVLATMKEENGTFRVECSNKKMERYLSILSCVNTKELINSLKKQKFSYSIFSSKKLEGIDYITIPEEDHLLMLSHPSKLIERLI